MSRYDHTDWNILGEQYDWDNSIHVYLRRIEGIEDLCFTIIHEYWHYMLSSVDYYIELDAMRRRAPKMSISRHPHEVKCNRYANRYKKRCLEELGLMPR